MEIPYYGKAYRTRWWKGWFLEGSAALEEENDMMPFSPKFKRKVSDEERLKKNLEYNVDHVPFVFYVIFTLKNGGGS